MTQYQNPHLTLPHGLMSRTSTKRAAAVPGKRACAGVPTLPTLELRTGILLVTLDLAPYHPLLISQLLDFYH